MNHYKKYIQLLFKIWGLYHTGIYEGSEIEELHKEMARIYYFMQEVEQEELCRLSETLSQIKVQDE